MNHGRHKIEVMTSSIFDILKKVMKKCDRKLVVETKFICNRYSDWSVGNSQSVVAYN